MKTKQTNKNPSAKPTIVGWRRRMEIAECRMAELRLEEMEREVSTAKGKPSPEQLEDRRLRLHRLYEMWKDPARHFLSRPQLRELIAAGLVSE